VITGIASAAPASTSLPPGIMGGPRPGGRR
jgi:hypothetical protein